VSVGKRPFFEIATSPVAGDMPLTIDFSGGAPLQPAGEGSVAAPSLLGCWFCVVVSVSLTLTCLTFAFGLSRLTLRLVSGQEQFAQGLQVTPQDAQGHVTLEATLALVTATF
jgi:hypothetical protein